MKRVDLAYMAGLFDGEGCINIKKKGRYYSLNCKLNMANEFLPNLYKFSFGGSLSKVPQEPPIQTQLAWSITSRNATTFLEAILPYLKLKRNEAELAIKFQNGFSHQGGNRISDGQLVLREAQKILLSKMKIKQ